MMHVHGGAVGSLCWHSQVREAGQRGGDSAGSQEATGEAVHDAGRTGQVSCSACDR
jgi:hypothetical protein